MRTSIAITDFSEPTALGTGLEDLARFVDDTEIDSLFVSDHLMQAAPHTEVTAPMLEAFTTLGFLAAHTRRVRLGALVAAVTMRPPAVLIKAVSTLDVLSGGRAWFGIGAGYHQQEADAYGLVLPATKEPFEWLEDTLRLARHMWSGDNHPFVGVQLTAEQPTCSPPPVTVPHPPILIGGTGETKTLPLVARYGDACNLFDVPDGGATIHHKLDVLAQHCATEGRPFHTITKTVSTRLEAADTARSFVARAREFGEVGIDHLVVLADGAWTLDRVGVLADAASMLAEQATAEPFSPGTAP